MASDELQVSRQHVVNRIADMLGELMYYGRKGDEDLPVGRIELLVQEGVITPAEIVAEFQTHVFEYFKVTPP